jgi:hypothetical protein
MATFDPDAYLSRSSKPFDPDAYLSKQTAPASTPKTFDPDAYLKSGTPDTIEKIRQEATSARKQWQSTELAPSTTAPVEGTGGAAFGVFAVQGKQRQQNIEARKEQQKALEIPYEQLITRDDYLDVINKGMKAVGERPFDPNKETRKQFVDRAYTNRRLIEYNTVFGLVPELIAIKNSGKDTGDQIALFRQLYSEAEDNPNKLKAGLDVAFAIIKDPSTYMGLGFGKAASGIAVRKGFEKLSKDEATRAAEKLALGQTAKRVEVITSAGTESVIGLAGNITQQRLDQETARRQGKEVPEFSAAGAAMATLLPGVVSGAVSAKLTKAPTIKERGEIIRKELVDRNITTATPTAPLTSAEQKIANALSKDFETVHSEYVKAYGKELMDEIDPGTALTQPKVREEFSRSAVKTALQLMKDDPIRFGWDSSKEQISDAIYRTFSQVDKIDDVALEAALNKAGLNAEQFAAMTKATVSSGARDMQVLSVAARLQKRAREIDPGFNKRIEELYGAKAGDTAPTGFFDMLGKGVSATGRGFKRLERETLAIVTSGIDTLTRNIYGNTIGATVKSAAQLMEGFNYSVNAALKAADGQKIATFKKSSSDAFKDAFGTGVYLYRNGLAEDVMERVLSSNPVLLSRMTNLTQDVEMQNISSLAKWAQSLNSAMDNMSRRASFTASLESQLNRVGIDLYKDVLPGNKEVPTSILKRAVDDAFKDTFAYSPNEFIKSYSAFEDAFESVGAKFVKGAEAIPGSTLVVPFARFITNAIAFQYKYSPLGFTGAAQYKSQAKKLLAEGNIEAAEKVNREGNLKVAQGVIGTAALLWAIDYRSRNQDVKFHEIKVGSGNETVDVRAIFPIAPVLAVAEAGVRIGKGTPTNWKEISETIAGFKMPAGASNSFIEGLFNLVNSEEKLASAQETIGKMAGDFVGRVSQPFVAKQVFDLIDLIRGDEAMTARDPNVTTAETGGGRMAELAAQRVQAKLPVVKESLPPAIIRFKEEPTTVREGEFFNRLVGFRTVPNRTEAEKEIIKYGTDLYKVYGRPSGEKEFDRLFIQNTNRYAIGFVNDDIKTSQYQSLTSGQKQERINNVIGKAVEEAKKTTEAIFSQEFPEKLNRIEYLREPAKVKKMINELYARDHGGKTIEETKAYNLVPKYKELAVGPTKYAKGGMVQQMHQLFGR